MGTEANPLIYLPPSSTHISPLASPWQLPPSQHSLVTSWYEHWRSSPAQSYVFFRYTVRSQQPKNPNKTAFQSPRGQVCRAVWPKQSKDWGEPRKHSWEEQVRDRQHSGREGGRPLFQGWVLQPGCWSPHDTSSETRTACDGARSQGHWEETRLRWDPKGGAPGEDQCPFRRIEVMYSTALLYPT